MKRRLVVVGGVAAGMSAASRAKRLDPNLDVTVLERGDYISYGACSLPYFVAGNFDDYRKLIARTPEEAAQQGIDVRTGHDVHEIDLQAGVVRTVVAAQKGSSIPVDTGAGENAAHGGVKGAVTKAEFPFDVLVIATGAQAIVPSGWGIGEMDGVFLLRHVHDGRAMKRWLDRSEGVGKAVVIGGGYIGVEVVDTLLVRGVAVTVVDMADQLLTNFDADVARFVQDDFRRAGVDVRLGQAVAGLEAKDGRLTGVRLASGEIIEADMAVVALGVRPNVQLAQASGIALGPTGAIAVDAEQRTNIPHVFAAGDCCETRHLITAKPVYIPLGTTANKQGRVAGTVIGGGQAAFAGVVGTAVVKAHTVSVARTGLTEAEARAEGFEVASATITANDRADSYPGVQKVTVKLVAEKRSGRLLGAQIAGSEPLAVSGRIDVVATALHNEMNVDDFSQLDLSYSPPFAPVWDALLVAANVLQRHV